MRNILQELQIRFGADEKLTPFFNYATEIPDSFEYVETSFLLRDRGETPRLRSAFMREITKQALHKYLGKTFGNELLQMGVPNTEIDRMIEFGYRPKSIRGNRLDFTYDHMRSLFWGGDNRPENICLMPGKMNSWKNILEQLQIKAITEDHEYRRSGKLITLMPKVINGKRNQVPYIKGGFREYRWTPKS